MHEPALHWLFLLSTKWFSNLQKSKEGMIKFALFYNQFMFDACLLLGMGSDFLPRAKSYILHNEMSVAIANVWKCVKITSGGS